MLKRASELEAQSASSPATQPQSEQPQSAAPTSGRVSQTPPAARSIIDESMSPFCPGLSLSACPSPSADSLRSVIIARVRAGDSREVIEQDLYRDFGSAIRGAPLAEGMGLVAWVMPGFAMTLGAIFLTRWIYLRRNPRFTGALPSSSEMYVEEQRNQPVDARAEARAKSDADDEQLNHRLNEMLKRDS